MTATELPASARAEVGAEPDRRASVLILACGALARELRAVIELNRWTDVTVDHLPAELHNRPDRIPDAVAERLDLIGDRYDRILLGYADCGTGGRLDRLCEERGLTRLPGAHCYQFFAGLDEFDRLHRDEIGTLYLTDYLARHFDRLIIDGLGIGAHPELQDMYFGNYTRVVHLVQSRSRDDGRPDLADYRQETARRAAAAADRLGLPLTTVVTGYGEMATTMVEFLPRAPAPVLVEGEEAARCHDVAPAPTV